MKKPFKNTLVGKIMIGAADGLTGGTISNLVYADENTPAGQIDFKRAGASVATVILTIGFLSGKINLADLLTVLEALK